MKFSDWLSSTKKYANRAEAGELLASALTQYRGQNVLVLGIPRGGVPVASAVAQAIDADLDVIVARKIGAPRQPELAIGAVTANGGLYLDDEAVSFLAVDHQYLNQEIAHQSSVARQREERFRNGMVPPCTEGRTVIIVDDGLATGATMRAAVRSVTKQRPERLVVAVPVGSRQACDELTKEADEIICLTAPAPFWAVGLHYEDFTPVEDEDVQRILETFRSATVGAPSRARAADEPRK